MSDGSKVSWAGVMASREGELAELQKGSSADWAGLSFPTMLYFDHNATTPVLPEARAAWLEATEKYVGNPSSPHRMGQRSDAALQSARERLAGFLGCDAMDMVWTSGATESNNMVLQHAAHSSRSDAE